MERLCDPGPILRPFVASFWTSESGPTSFGFRQVIPDGKPGLVIRYTDGGYGPRVFLGGQATKSSEYQMYPNQRFIGVHFQSVGAAEFLGIPIGEITDMTLDLRDWDSRWARELEERIDAASSRYERSVVVRRLLERKLADVRPDTVTVALVEAIKNGAGTFKSRDLCQISGTSERQVERKFYEKVGLSPRELNSIIRFRRALSKARRCPEMSLTEIAFASGYSDQSHFIRDFKKMTGASPRKYLGSDGALNDWQGLDL